jgi:ABC-2 type transport system ATP-binding protein
VLLKHGVMQYDGSPREAIRELRAGFEQDRREGQPRDGHGDPTSRGSIREVRLLSPDGEPVRTLEAGDAMVARVAVDLDDSVDRYMVGFAIETPLGQRVYHVNTHVEGVELKTGAGRHEVEFRLPALHLGEGEYVVRIGVGEVVGEMIDLQPQAASFNVNSSSAGNGVLNIPTTIDVLS